MLLIAPTPYYLAIQPAYEDTTPTMRSVLISLPLLVLASSSLAAPTPKCGWKHPSTIDITKTVSGLVNIDVRAALATNGVTIADPVNINTRAAPPPFLEIPNVARIDC